NRGPHPFPSLRIATDAEEVPFGDRGATRPPRPPFEEQIRGHGGRGVGGAGGREGGSRAREEKNDQQHEARDVAMHGVSRERRKMPNRRKHSAPRRAAVGSRVMLRANGLLGGALRVVALVAAGS